MYDIIIKYAANDNDNDVTTIEPTETQAEDEKMERRSIMRWSTLTPLAWASPNASVQQNITSTVYAARLSGKRLAFAMAEAEIDAGTVER
jgi:hypothetical protein